MPVIHAPKIEQIAKKIGDGVDPKKAITDAVGDLAEVDVPSDLVLVGVAAESDRKFITRNDGTKVEFFKSPDQVKEAQYQSKVGLVLKKGPVAGGDWEDDEHYGSFAPVGSWVVYHVGDAWPLSINGAPCRLVPYEKIRLRVKDPSIIY